MIIAIVLFLPRSLNVQYADRRLNEGTQILRTENNKEESSIFFHDVLYTYLHRGEQLAREFANCADRTIIMFVKKRKNFSTSLVNSRALICVFCCFLQVQDQELQVPRACAPTMGIVNYQVAALRSVAF